MSEVAVAEKAKPGPAARGLLGLRKKSRRLGVRVDMTPMVDIAFLLLIFFMVTTVFRRPLAMEVNLPEPEARVEVPESNVMTIYVDKDETLFMREGRAPLRTIAWADLRPTFESRAAANPNLIVLVKIHRGARYEPMVDMMDTLEDAKMQRFSLVEMKEADVTAVEAAR
jgi:biopolymer transport protein ExbD